MKPYNLADRNKKTQLFAAVYAAGIFLSGFLVYLVLRGAPQEQRRLAMLTQDKIEALLAHTDEADSLVLQIQRAGYVPGEKLIPFYKWSNDLKTVYHQPFYTVIVNSYTDLVKDLKTGAGDDSTMTSLKNKMLTLQQENLKLKTAGKELSQELQEAKLKKQRGG